MVWLTAGLWHSGFTKLDYPKLCRIAVPLLFMAAISRAFLMNVNLIFFITVPAILTIAVFVLYLFTFVPYFRIMRLRMIRNKTKGRLKLSDGLSFK